MKNKGLQKWQSEWDSSKEGALTKTFFPKIKDRLAKRQQICLNLSKVITGHGKLRAYLHRSKITGREKLRAHLHRFKIIGHGKLRAYLHRFKITGHGKLRAYLHRFKIIGHGKLRADTQHIPGIKMPFFRGLRLCC